jgi:hypothetical protein
MPAWFDQDEPDDRVITALEREGYIERVVFLDPVKGPMQLGTQSAQPCGCDLGCKPKPHYCDLHIQEKIYEHCDAIDAALSRRSTAHVDETPKDRHDYVDWGSGEQLAMTALDQYPVEDRLPKSTSVVYRVHQLGRDRNRLREALISIALGGIGIEHALTIARDAIRKNRS